MSGDIEGISEGRRKVALEKAEEARREWLRAERAEAEVATLRAEVEKLRAALDEIIPFAVYSLAEMNKERNTKSLKKAIAKAVAALGEEKKG